MAAPAAADPAAGALDWPAAPAVMAIINATPDSFSGPASDPVRAGHEAVEAGAAILDVGGESTRPGAIPADPAEERRRVLPVIRALRGAGAPVSIDTRNACTMAAALDAGAGIVNDVSGLRHDPRAAGVVAEAGCLVVLMHMRGTPETMDGLACYADVVSEVAAELADRVAGAEAAGIRRERIAIDPGLGFAKTAAQSAMVLSHLRALTGLGLAVVVGASRKRFLGALGGGDTPAARDAATIAAGLFAVSQGASVVRVHDAPAMLRALRVWRALGAGCAEGIPGGSERRALL